MASHGIWNGSISFGLVTIPISLRPAVEDHDLKFTMLDSRDLAPVGYKHVNKKSGKEVAWHDIVKGYEYGDGKYVVMKSEDFAKANVKANQLLEIEDFVGVDEVEPICFEKPYFIVPDTRGVKAYNLLREAMQRTQKIGIGRVVLHTKYRLVAIMPMEKGMVLEVLRFPHELRSPAELELPASAKRQKADPRELATAEKLIAGLTSTWDPSKYKDTYHEDLLRVIHQKIKRGATAEIEPYNEPSAEQTGGKGKLLDLMPLLQASLKAKRSTPTAAAPKKRPASRAKSVKKRVAAK